MGPQAIGYFFKKKGGGPNLWAGGPHLILCLLDFISKKSLVGLYFDSGPPPSFNKKIHPMDREADQVAFFNILICETY